MAETRRQLLPGRAAELIGREELAIRLKVPHHLLDAWMKGHASMSDRKLVMLIDLLDQIAGSN